MMPAINRPLLGESVDLRSPLSPTECLGLLKQNTDPLWKLFGSRPVIGSVRGASFKGYKRINYRNSYQTLVFAHITPEGAGSKIAMRFGVSTFAFVFTALWSIGLLLIGGTMFIYACLAYSRGHAATGLWVFLVVPPMMAMFGFGLYKFGRWLGRNEKPFLIEFIMTTLKAQRESD